MSTAKDAIDPNMYFMTEAKAAPYAPRGHSGTVNRRIVSPETGATQIEVLIGRIEPGEGASPHLHPGIDQFCWMLEGRARVEIGGLTREIGPEESCFFPADMPHTFTAIGETPVKVLICYGPPYGEGARVEC
ncbi:cupin domain-containing protein [Rhodovulum sulfidophilum]|uniref:cupin domain-containing protein n=1 Tax=Rhodovulum sulfidophilum TaxID=35806 RepID=UPI001F23D092|nr:cupin domain-containing protein [Rhodovulum sulfidophilum]MCE8438698.1 cupin domain-containing protein [Rhodovulum sulfidophilum]MCE8469838.1 cupin domain-containing protein [Rhodovulum sulfidophilum]